jgi:LmbE family N-acetylglucosaminyl deacetylase
MKNKKILVFSPHADDVEIAMGGTIAKLSQDNEIVLVTCILPTENRAGDKDQQMIDNRGTEQAKSAEILGAELHLMNLDAYKFAYNREYVKLFDQLIVSHDPDVVFSCWEHDTHQDHQTLAKILYSALRKNNISYYMYESTNLPGGLGGNQFAPQVFVDISGDPLKKKIEALKQYQTYIGNAIESIIARSKYKGGIIGVDHAESFQVIKQLEL